MVDSLSMMTTDLQQTIQDFDRYLRNDYLDQLSLDEVAYVLQKVETFNEEAKRHQQRVRLGISDGTRTDAQPRTDMDVLIAAGCRLCSDLVEKIFNRMMDQVQDSDQSIQTLQEKLRGNLQNRYESNQMMQKAMQVRKGTSRTAEDAGLGIIL